ncbi:hypothetical protein VU677_06045 [Hafnia paralvei]|uniref:hypothetical protein n=1 Tax=Hafnia paralvei TaxID=546367 RepID=UPI00300D4CA4
MIDAFSRKQIAQAIRQFSIGRISNYQYEQRVSACISTEDAIVKRFMSDAEWITDDDEFSLKDEQLLTAQEKEENARIILFLRSNLEYRWPEPEITTLSWFYITGVSCFLLTIILAQYGTQRFWQATLGTVILTCLWTHHLRNKRKKREQDALIKASGGDKSVWPFFNHEEYRQALARPIYLAGPR